MRDATYPFTIHDLKQLINKFAFEKSFSEESGGGGRQSNAHALPYVMHMALYVMNTYVRVRALVDVMRFMSRTRTNTCTEIL